MFALLNAFQNDMTWQGSTKNHGGCRFQGKGHGLTHRDWAGVLPTQMFLNQVTPENFIQFCPSVQKLFVIFFNTDRLIQRWTDRQTDRHKNSIQNKSPHYPKQVQAEFFLYPIFSTSLKTVWAHFAHSLHFVWIIRIHLYVNNFTKNCGIDLRMFKFWQIFLRSFVKKSVQTINGDSTNDC